MYISRYYFSERGEEVTVITFSEVIAVTVVGMLLMLSGFAYGPKPPTEEFDLDKGVING